jgi:hypothetical protein
MKEALTNDDNSSFAFNGRIFMVYFMGLIYLLLLWSSSRCLGWQIEGNHDVTIYRQAMNKMVEKNTAIARKQLRGHPQYVIDGSAKAD